MTKQKIVIKVMMKNEKKTRKALSLAAQASGVQSVGLVGPGKEQIEVTGEGIDVGDLNCLLRSRIGHTEIMSVSHIEEKKKDKPPAAAPPEPKEKPVPVECCFLPHHHPCYVPPMPLHVVYDEPCNICSIL